MPNLQQRSHEMFRYLWKKRVFGIRRPRKPTQSPTEAAVLLSYFVASLIYKVFISIAILLFVAQQLFFIGMLMAVGGIIGLVLTPIAKFLNYLLTSPELQRQRPRAVASTLAACGMVVVLIAWPKLPDHGRARGVIEPARLTAVHAQIDGVLEEPVRPLGPVSAGRDTLASLRNDALRTRFAEAQARHREVLAIGRRVQDQEPAAAAIYHEQAKAAAEAVAEARRDLARQVIEAPGDGLWVPADLENVHGAPVSRGDRLGSVIDPDALEVHLAADQYVGPRIAAHVTAGTLIDLRPHGRPELNFHGRVRRVLRAGQDRLPSEALGVYAGGDIAVEPDEDNQSAPRATRSYFLVIVEPHEADAARFAELMRPGQRVVARFRWPDASLLEQVYLAARQTLQDQLSI
jgi:putative peptide zinc metalloprotease protein